MRIAALPWYDLPELREQTDALWAGIARELAARSLRGVPARLERDVEPDALLGNPDLLLSQTCGTMLGERAGLRPVATPRYAAPGCQGSEYASFVVVARDSDASGLEDLRGTRCVINDPRSHSGANCLRALLAPLQRGGRFFSGVEASGSHLRSLEWIARGRADTAAIDCVTFELARRTRPALTDTVRALCTTPPAPAPPYIAGPGVSDRELGVLREALSAALSSEATRHARSCLLLAGIDVRPLSDYAPLAAEERHTRALGYREL
jgi:ABC-type phosphate/phosphonate transport system substrate-binding protein